MLAYAERAMQMVTGRVQIPKTATNTFGVPPGDRTWDARRTDGAGGAGRAASELVPRAIDPRQEAARGPPFVQSCIAIFKLGHYQLMPASSLVS